MPVSRLLIVAFIALLAHVGMGCTRTSKQVSVSFKLSPAQWPQQARDRYLALQAFSGGDKVAVSAKGMIAGTSEPFAVHAGLEALRNGGSAADAALTTALAQVALTVGSTISYAGFMTVVYYDASTARTYTLNAGYNTVQKERDPVTIPVMGSHSGRYLRWYQALWVGCRYCTTGSASCRSRRYSVPPCGWRTRESPWVRWWQTCFMPKRDLSRGCQRRSGSLRNRTAHSTGTATSSGNPSLPRPGERRDPRLGVHVFR